MIITTVSNCHRSDLCRSCGLRATLAANLHNLVFGWWSLGGLLRTPGALINNARGGKLESESNAILLYRLASHELQTNHNTSALALLDQARNLTQNASLVDRIERLLKRLGNPSTRAASVQGSAPNFLFYHALMILLPAIAVVLLLNPHWLLRAATVPAPIGAGEPVTISPFHRPLYGEERLGQHYSLGLVDLHQEAAVESRVLTRIPVYHQVRVESVADSVWLKVSSGMHSGYVREAEMGFGDATIARKEQCNKYPQPRPFDGEILKGIPGEASLGIVNEKSEDAMLQFYNGKTPLLSLYLRGESTLEFNRLPAQATDLRVTHGTFYNASCGVFTRINGSKRYRLTLFGTNQAISL
ncbi:hypothetical protein [Aestuariirhabdus sp. LZHN29]|uniref:hypothetical protein n=1 Tax=Aestuariirhabdus sp. LZHN29 TaxID=3417462 RepID=UPI003CF8D169